MSEMLEVPRASFDIEEPWTPPAGSAVVQLRNAVDGSVPRLVTSVAIHYDDDYLTFLFSGADDFVRATHVEHDAPLYEEDVVEVFLAPDELTHYFEIEVSPRGTAFDAKIDSPDGVRATMRADRSWTCEGLVAAVRQACVSDGARTIDTLIRIPFFALERSTPGDGEVWRANLFRIDRHPAMGDEYSAWQPTMKRPADFHLPAAFGSIRFTA